MKETQKKCRCGRALVEVSGMSRGYIVCPRNRWFKPWHFKKAQPKIEREVTSPGPAYDSEVFRNDPKNRHYGKEH